MRRSGILLVILLAALTMMPRSLVFAHGGEDHGDKPAPAVATGTGMVTHTARAGDMEVTVKHPALEPDKEVAARVFITHFATNEPVGGANIVVTLTGEGGAPVESAATASATSGMYEVKLPPLPKGQYKLTARVEHDGETQTAQYGALQVAPLPVAAASSVATWARSALIALALILGLGIAGFVVYRVMQNARRRAPKDEFKEETATA